MAFDKTRPLGSDLVSDLDTILQANFAELCKRSIFWLFGYPSASTTQGVQYTMTTGGTITKAWAKCTTAPTGQSMIFDIHINGTSIWDATQANRLSIAATTLSGSQTAFDTSTFVAGDVITIDIDQVGSSVGGSGVTVQLDYEVNG